MTTAETLTVLHPLLIGWCAVLGLLLGSFLNVVAYRVPAGLSVVSPGSACPRCEHPIRWFDNLPVLSWLVLRGKCRDCAAPIAWRYPAVEAATGALFTVLALKFGITVVTPFLLWAAAAGVALFLIDLDTFRLPDKVNIHTWAAAAAGTLTLAVTGTDVNFAVVGWSTLLWAGVYFVPWLVTGGRGMGFGDVKLAPALGALLGWFGWGTTLVGLLSGFLLGAVLGAVLMVRGKAGRKTAVPFGPFMLTGALIGLLAGDALFGGYLRLFGL